MKYSKHTYNYQRTNQTSGKISRFQEIARKFAETCAGFGRDQTRFAIGWPVLGHQSRTGVAGRFVLHSDSIHWTDDRHRTKRQLTNELALSRNHGRNAALRKSDEPVVPDNTRVRVTVIHHKPTVRCSAEPLLGTCAERRPLILRMTDVTILAIKDA